jgi:o-succinylbenzoate synthase
LRSGAARLAERESKQMRIEKLIVREIRVRLKTPFETSFGRMDERRIILVEALSDGISGWGEITAGEGPYYNSETTDTAWIIFSEFIAPLVVGREVGAAADVAALLAPIRGHEMTKAGLECALWDLEAKQKRVPLARLLGGRREEIACGVSIGIQDSPAALAEIVEQELAAGYQRIKVKIKPGKDFAFVEKLRERFPQIDLMVDANSAYTLADLPHLKTFDRFRLMMIEQPLAWDDIYQHAQLQAEIRTPVCLDESIHNCRDAEAAIAAKACGVINVKLGRVSGHDQAKRIERLCREKAVPVWCGGMLESGIGRAHNIAMSSLPGFVLPGDVSASRRYWDEDIIDPEVTVSPQGTIRVPVSPGIGYEVRKNRIEKLTVRQQSFESRPAVVSVG